MRTPEDFRKQFETDVDESTDFPMTLENTFKEALLEAYHAGLTRAAEIAKLREDGSLGQTSARANIIARILKEKDSKTTL